MKIVATKLIKKTFTNEEVKNLLDKFFTGDYGISSNESKELNKYYLNTEGGFIVGSYKIKKKLKKKVKKRVRNKIKWFTKKSFEWKTVWITRSFSPKYDLTTVLFPEEY